MTLASTRNFREHPPEFRRTKNKTLDVKSFYLSSNHFSTKHNRLQLVVITLPTAKRSPSCVNLSRQLFTEADLALPVEDKKKLKLKQSICFPAKSHFNLGMLHVSKNTPSITRIKAVRAVLLLSKSALGSERSGKQPACAQNKGPAPFFNESHRRPGKRSRQTEPVSWSFQEDFSQHERSSVQNLA